MISNFQINEEKSEKEAKQKKLIDLMINVGKTDSNISLQRFYFELMELEKNPISLTEIIFNLLTENFNTNKIIKLEENDQKCFLIYVKNWTNKLINIDKAAHIKNLSDTIFKIMLLFFSDGIYNKNKQIFEEIFKSMFLMLKNNREMNPDKMNIFIYKIFHDMRDEIQNNENISGFRIKNILILLEALASYHSEIVKYTNELNEYFNLLYIILEKFNFYNFTTDLNDNLEIIKNKITLFNNIVGSFCKISIKIFNDTFKKELLLKSLANLNENNDTESLINECFLNYEKFLLFIKKTMKMNISFDVNLPDEIPMSESIFVIDLNNKENIIYQINTAKSNTIELITLISENLTKSNAFDQYETYKNFIKLLFIELLKALGEFYKINYKNSNEILYIEKSDNSEGELVLLKYLVRIINFLTVSASNSIGESFFNENKIEILRYIIMPSLRITPLERDLFLIDPDEFTKTIYDMTYKQNTNQPKIKTVKLVDILCEYIDSFPKFITQFYVDIIYYVISKNNSNFTGGFTLLTDPKMNFFYEFLLTFSDEDLLDQALQILSSISYLVYDKSKLQKFFEEKIDQINHILVNIQDEFIRAKLCNFYAYCIEDMFHDHKQVLSKSFDDSMHFMFNCLLSQNKHVSLNFIALDSIHSIIFIDDMKLVVSDIVKLYIKDVLCMIDNNYYKELTNNIIFHKFVKYLLSHFFKEIENNLIYIFAYFWKDVKSQILSVISEGININNENNPVLKEKNFKILEDIHNIKSLLVTCIEKSEDIDSKTKIFNEILNILNHIDRLVNYDYEEDILELISLIFNDIKLIPNNFINSLNLLLDKFITNYKFKFEGYHINFIFTFLKNLRREDYLKYKEKLYEMINKRLLFIEKSTSVMKIINNHLNIANLLNFYWDDLVLDYADTEFIKSTQLGDSNDYFNILNLITKRLGIQPIADEYLVTKLCLNFYLLVIKLDSIGLLKELKKFQNLEILLIKTITFPTIEDSPDENSVSAIFASKMIYFLFTEYFDIIKNYKNEFQDNSIVNFIKHLINFNIDQLLYLRKASVNLKEKNKFQEEIKIKKSGKSSDLDNENEIIDVTERIYDRLMDKKKIGKGCFSDDEESEGNEDSENVDSEGGSEKNERDLIDEIVNENENNSDKDDDFLKVKKKPKDEFHNFFINFSNQNFIQLLSALDEFQIFNEVLNYLSQISTEIYLHLISSFPKTKLNLMETIRKFKKIMPSGNNSGTAKFRKIVKIKK